ncbi:glycosyltransferase family 2 protein [Chloroherpeton thalassium]|nr:glycosyltransferase family 2 protein [Chloroherpeton thalassium]
MKISIVTPSYNQASFLEETMLSVLSQDYKDLEYVLIDGGSLDGSLEIIRKYESKLHYWVSEKDNGHGHALNKGFAHTSGEIMAWLNSDDKYLPWTFQTVNKIFSDFPHVNWIVGFNAWWNDKGVLTSAKRVPKNIYDFLIGRYGWIQQESVFWRRNLWEKAGGYISENVGLMVDGELWTRFFLHDELYTVDCILSGYREHADNRAKMRMDMCDLEMKQYIGIMYNKCNESIKNKYTLVNKLYRLANHKVLRLFLFDFFLKKINGYYNLSYKNIFYCEEWRERKLEFYYRNNEIFL